MKPRNEWHKDVTDKAVIQAAKQSILDLDSLGFCLACGNVQDGCEPDARGYICEHCGEDEVYGAEELLMSL